MELASVNSIEGNSMLGVTLEIVLATERIVLMATKNRKEAD